MKYVIYENDRGQFAVLIPNILIHKTTFDMVRHSDLTTDRNGSWHKPVAAGFCTVKPKMVDLGDSGETFFDIEVTCFGESESMGLKSRGAEDAVVVEQLLKSTS